MHNDNFNASWIHEGQSELQISPLGYEMKELYEPSIDKWTVKKVLNVIEDL